MIELEEVMPSSAVGYELEYDRDPKTGKRQLTEECNKRLLQLAQEGNTWAREDFFRENFAMVAYVANMFGNSAIEFDDRIGHCQLAFFRAFNTFECDKTDSTFSTYAINCMKNELIRVMSHQRRGRRAGELATISGDAPVSGEGEVEVSLIDLCGSDDLEFGAIERKQYIAQILGAAYPRMKQRNREIFHSFYLEGVSMAEMAERYGTKRQGIHRILKHSMQIVREVVQEQEGTKFVALG